MAEKYITWEEMVKNLTKMLDVIPFDEIVLIYNNVADNAGEQQIYLKRDERYYHGFYQKV